VAVASSPANPGLGKPLRGPQVRVVDDANTKLPTRGVGRLQLRVDAVTPGYLTEDGPLPAQDAAGWTPMTRGHLVEDGQIVVCGRRKDVIIMAGRNIYPTDIEHAASTVEGVRAGNVVAVRLAAGPRRESFAVAVESKLVGGRTGSADDPQTGGGQGGRRGRRPAARVVVLPPAVCPEGRRANSAAPRPSLWCRSPSPTR
jgi:fatty-acyl-CoA synthase